MVLVWFLKIKSAMFRIPTEKLRRFCIWLQDNLDLHLWLIKIYHPFFKNLVKSIFRVASSNKLLSLTKISCLAR